MPQTIRLATRTGDWTAEVDGDRVSFPDAGLTFVVRDEGGGRFSVEGPGGTKKVSSASAGDVVWVGLGGLALDFEVKRGEARTRSTAREHDALMPPMSATVVRIHVRPGDRVAAGDTLIVLEAMKMELPIRAPRAATIRAINCTEGQLVHPGMLLMEMAD